jgi:hypothetical protein
MNYKLATILLLLIYGLDCLIITPYILYHNLGIEAGLLMSWGYLNFGLIWFYLWFISFSIILFYILKFLFGFYDKILKENAKYPKYAIIIGWYIGMIGVIMNNIRYIF